MSTDNIQEYHKYLQAFSMKTLQSSSQIVDIIIKNDLDLQGFLKYVEEIRLNSARTVVHSPKYIIVDGKKIRRKRTPQERALWKEMLAKAKYGSQLIKP